MRAIWKRAPRAKAEPLLRDVPVVELKFRMGLEAFAHFTSQEGVVAYKVWLVEEPGSPGVWGIVAGGLPRGWSRVADPMLLVERLPTRSARPEAATS